MSRKTWIILALLLGPIVVLVVLAATGWGGDVLPRFPNTQFVIAFAIGATLTALVAAGLFALIFISSRRGFDEAADNHMTDGHMTDGHMTDGHITDDGQPAERSGPDLGEKDSDGA